MANPPFNVVPQTGPTPGTSVASIDNAGNEVVSGNLTVGGVIYLDMSPAPVQSPGQVAIYSSDGKSVSFVGAGGQSVTQNFNSIIVNGNETLGGQLNIQPVSTGTTDISSNVGGVSAFDNFRLLGDGTHQWGTGSAARDTFLARTGVGLLSVTQGSFSVTTAGQGLAVKEGSNAKQGTATLSAGTVVVANTSVTATSRIFLTCQSLGTVSSPSALCVSARTPGTSFTILASQGTDTSVIAYEIFEQG